MMKVPKARRLSSGTWFIQLRLGGESVTVNARSEKECVRQAQYVKSEYLAGKRAPSEPKAELPTLAQAIDQYLADKPSLSPSTIRGYTQIRNLRFRTLMDRSLSDITREDYIAACNAEARRCSAKTLKNAWGLVRSVVRYTTGSLPPEVTLPQVVPQERPFLDPDEIKVFLSAVRGSPYEIPLLLALSSLRRSEIMALRWENIDFKRRIISVSGAAVMNKDNQLTRKQANKNRASTRKVPILMDQLYDALAAAKKPDGLVVTCHPNTIGTAARKICLSAGLPPVSTHGLRHSFASLAYHLNVPEKITMEIGGWSDDHTMRKIYTHIARSDVRYYETQFADFFQTS